MKKLIIAAAAVGLTVGLGFAQTSKSGGNGIAKSKLPAPVYIQDDRGGLHELIPNYDSETLGEMFAGARKPTQQELTGLFSGREVFGDNKSYASLLAGMEASGKSADGKRLFLLNVICKEGPADYFDTLSADEADYVKKFVNTPPLAKFGFDKSSAYVIDAHSKDIQHVSGGSMALLRVYENKIIAQIENEVGIVHYGYYFRNVTPK